MNSTFYKSISGYNIYQGLIYRYRIYLLAFLLYAVLFLIITYPLILHLNNGIHLGDPSQNAWTLAWDVHSILTSPLNLFNSNIFYPDTTNTLAFVEHMMGDMVFAFPIILLTNNPVLTYNLVLILSYALSGLGIFLLADHYIDDKRASFVAGAVFTFCSFRMAQFVHLQILTAQWIPFALLYLDKFLDKPDNKNMFFLYLFSVLQILSSWYLAFYLSISLALYFIYMALFDPKTRARLFDPKFVLKVLALLVLMALTIAPFALPYIYLNQSRDFTRDLGQVGLYSADVSDYLISPWYNLIYDFVFHAGLPLPISGENTLFIGFTAAFLATVALLPVLKAQRPLPREKLVKFFYVSLALAGFILSLGSPLHVFGYTLNVNLPYYYLYKFLPGFASMRVPSRFDLLVMLALSILAGFGMKKLLVSFRGQWKDAVVIVAVAIVLVEPLPGFSTNAVNTVVPTGAGIPAVYQWLAAQPDNTSILELPINQEFGNVQFLYLYYSTYHWKDLVNGFDGGFQPPNYPDLVSVVNGFPSPESLELVRQYGVSYVIVHSAFLNTSEWQKMKEYIGDSPEVRLVEAFGSDYVYQVAGDNTGPGNLSFAVTAPGSDQPLVLKSGETYTGILTMSPDSAFMITQPYDNITIRETIYRADGQKAGASQQQFYLPLVINGTGSQVAFNIVSPATAGNYTLSLDVAHGSDVTNVFRDNVSVRDDLLYFDSGPYNVEFWGSIPTQWMSDSAQISVMSSGDRNAALAFSAESYNAPRALQVLVNGHTVFQGNISTAFQNVSVPIHLDRGLNRLDFISLNGSTRPCDVLGNSTDQRPLSIAFQAIAIG